MVGKTLGHYEILEPLGKGGMGEVYLGEDTRSVPLAKALGDADEELRQYAANSCAGDFSGGSKKRILCYGFSDAKGGPTFLNRGAGCLREGQTQPRG